MSNLPKEMLGKRKRKGNEEVDAATKRRLSCSSDQSVSSVESSSSHMASRNTASPVLNPENFQVRPMSLQKTVESRDPSCISQASDRSKDQHIYFQRETMSLQKTVESRDPSCISLASDRSVYQPMSFQPETIRPVIPKCCVCEEAFEEDSIYFTCGHVACTRCIVTGRDQSETPDQYHCTQCETNQRVAPKKQALKLETWDRQLLDTIQKHKKEMHNRFSETTEGNGDNKKPLNHIYTSLSINFRSDVPQDHYFKSLSHPQLKKKDSQELEVNLSDLFVNLPTKLPRTVLTNGVAGIGKSFSVQKFIVDWAEGTAHKEVHFVFSLAFRELNLIKNEASFLQLLMNFHPALSDIDPQDLVRTKVIVILDGLDESRFHLDFKNTNSVTSVQEVTTVASLIRNLIQGNLLPSAQLWITSRPAASHQIPGEFIHRVTEIQGFNDRQKEEYFTKRFSNKPDVAKLVIAHIQSSQTVDLLCQIPIFCWISSVLFEDVFGGEEQTEVPQTLTEMMAAFLFVQTKRSSRKYDKNPEKERIKLLKAKKELLLKLGHLAFLHLLNNSLIFYVEDLQECGLDPTEATVNSGFFSAVLREEELFSQKKVYFFVHLTVQEFFAALYVYDCFTKNKTWAPELSRFLGLGHSDPSSRPCVFDLLKMAVDKVLENNRGQLAFFLRFLLGLVVESHQKSLRGLLVPLDPSQDTVKKMLHHLKAIRRKTISPDACINLFQTMVEMGDTKISEDIQEYLKSEDRSRIQLNPLHCSALAFTIQVSKSKLEELDIKSYNTSEEGRRRLIPAVRSSIKANLADCRVSEVWLKHLSLALSFPHSSLRDLNLSNNDLRDSGVELLCNGLRSPACKLKILRLSGCLVTEEGCRSLVSALKSNPSHLKELDLSYNHLGAGEAELTALKSDPQYNLSHLELNVSHGGSQRMMPGLRKYVCDLTWEKTHKSLQFSSDHKEVSRTKEGPDRVLVRGGQGLSDRCYWEIDATAPFNIGVTYWDSDLKGTEFRLGQNDKSWSFVCSEEGCYIFHKNQSIPVNSSYCSRWSRLAIYLDRPAGVLSFYRVSSDSRTHLHTFKEEFNQDLFPAVELQHKSSAQFCLLNFKKVN